MIDITTEKIICVLLKYQEPVTSVQIAKEIGMSSSTVKHNIRFVREFIESTGASLRSIPGKGFRSSAVILSMMNWRKCQMTPEINLIHLISANVISWIFFFVETQITRFKFSLMIWA